MHRTLVLLLILGVLGGVLQVRKRYFSAPPPLAEQAAPAVSQGAPALAALPADGQLVEVYGRDACGYTRRMLADLQAANVPVRYHDIDNPSVEAAFHERFEHAGLMHDGSYALPVVAVAGQSLARPSPGAVIYRYNAR